MSDQLAFFLDFENVAIWAEQEFFNFEVSRLMKYLQGRGAVVVKRAYADWTRFPRYRNEMLNNSIDLLQLYSVRAGKNRADIYMALDAFETAVTRSQIETFVLVSGDSDFGPLVSRLRAYGRYVVGIGPRSITHPLLINSCDEFVYLETILGEPPRGGEQGDNDQEVARRLLREALAVHGQRGELPVLAAKLKQKMLSMDSTFNEANLGYAQFSNFLEDSGDTVKLYFKDLQLYVAPSNYVTSPEYEKSQPSQNGQGRPTNGAALAAQYRRVFDREIAVDLQTRRDVLRDIYRELSGKPESYTADRLLDLLQERYEAHGLVRSKSQLLKIWQMGFHQRAYRYEENNVSFHAPVRLADDVDSEASFIRRAESTFVYNVIKLGLPVDRKEMAATLLNDAEQTEYIDSLLDDLVERGVLRASGDAYRLPERGTIPFANDPALQCVMEDIAAVRVPEHIEPGVDTVHALARRARLERSQDFVAAAHSYLLACRLELDALKEGVPGATVEDLRWLMASYASAKAGELSQIHHEYSAARPYYLAFFAMVKEEDPLWDRMRGLINPMLSYYWINVGRASRVTFDQTHSPANIAAQAVGHASDELRSLWQQVTEELAQVNPSLLTRIAEQLKLGHADVENGTEAAKAIEALLP